MFKDLCEKSINLKLPTKLLLFNTNTNDIVNPFDIITNDIEDSYIRILNYTKFNNKKIDPITYALIWGNKMLDVNDDNNENYIIASSFLSRFNIKLEYNQYVNGVESIKNFDNDKYIEHIKRITELEDFMNKYDIYDSTNKYRKKDSFTIEWNYRFDDYIDIFNSVILSEDIPYVVYNKGSISELGKKDVAEERKFKTLNKNITNFTKWVNETNIPNTIIFKVYNGSRDRSDIHSYLDVTFEFKDMQWYFDFTYKRSSFLKETITRIQKAFSEDIHHIIISMKSDFETSIILNTFIFVDMIYTNEILRKFIYVDESQETLSAKKRLSLHMSLDPDFEFKTTSTFSYRKDIKDEGNLLIQLNMSVNNEMEDFYFDFVRRLLTMYSKKAKKIMRYYNRALGNLEDYEEITYEEPSEGIKITKLKDLVFHAEDMFIKGYATTVCQAPFQPIIIRDEEAKKYIKKGFEPVRYEGLLFVSNNPKTPYISLKSHKLENSEKYPFLPCTSSKKTIETDEDFNPIETDDKASSYMLDEMKILPSGRYGRLNNEKINIIGDAKRIFVSTKNSFLSAVMMALNYDIDDKNIAKLKKKLSKLDFTPAKQELYNYTDAEIRHKILNEDIDSTEFVRLLEIFFEVNIFIFNHSSLQIPNHFIIYIPPHESEIFKKTIILYRHPNKRHELIIGKKYTFSKEIRDRLRELLTQQSGYIEFLNMTDNKNLLTKLNINVIPNIVTLPQYQTLDGAGKLRYLTYEYNMNGEDIKFSIETFYSPLSLPISDPVEAPNDLKQILINMGYKPYVKVNETSEIDTFKKIKSFSYVYKQVISILYYYYDGHDFMRRIKVYDGDFPYEHSLKSSRVPIFDSYKDAYNYFSSFFPSIKDKNIYVDNEDVYDGIYKYVSNILVTNIEHIDLYINNDDYMNYSPYQNIYNSENNILQNSIDEKRDWNISNKIIFTEEAYLYSYESSMYIIQNVKDGDKLRASSVLFNWDKYKINPGFYVEPKEYLVNEIQVLSSDPGNCILLNNNNWVAMIKIDTNYYRI